MKDIELCGVTSGIRLGEFTFNKVTGKLKVGVGSLGDVTPSDEATNENSDEGSGNAE